MLIKVTAEDIRVGLARNCTRCPIALALQRLTGDIYANAGHFAQVKGETYPLPFEAVNFMKKYDDGCFVEPFEFHIEEL